MTCGKYPQDEHILHSCASCVNSSLNCESNCLLINECKFKRLGVNE